MSVDLGGFRLIRRRSHRETARRHHHHFWARGAILEMLGLTATRFETAPLTLTHCDLDTITARAWWRGNRNPLLILQLLGSFPVLFLLLQLGEPISVRLGLRLPWKR